VTGYSVRVVADAIASFLAAHPACADTMDGIQQWWLSPNGIMPPSEVVARALQLLEMEGVVECRYIGQRAIWRLRHS
jgi:hypothetical protein